MWTTAVCGVTRGGIFALWVAWTTLGACSHRSRVAVEIHATYASNGHSHSEEPSDQLVCLKARQAARRAAEQVHQLSVLHRGINNRFIDALDLVLQEVHNVQNVRLVGAHDFRGLLIGPFFFHVMFFNRRLLGAVDLEQVPAGHYSLAVIYHPVFVHVQLGQHHVHQILARNDIERLQHVLKLFEGNLAGIVRVGELENVRQVINKLILLLGRDVSA